MLKNLLVIEQDAVGLKQVSWFPSAEYLISHGDGNDNIFILIAKFKPDLILIENQRSDRSGAIISSEIKHNPHTSSIPVGLFSSLPLLKADISVSHANFFFEKSISASALKEMVEQNTMTKIYYDEY